MSHYDTLCECGKWCKKGKTSSTGSGKRTLSAHVRGLRLAQRVRWLIRLALGNNGLLVSCGATNGTYVNSHDDEYNEIRNPS
jgi:hypothetical protein